MHPAKSSPSFSQPEAPAPAGWVKSGPLQGETLGNVNEPRPALRATIDEMKKARLKNNTGCEHILMAYARCNEMPATQLDSGSCD